MVELARDNVRRAGLDNVDVLEAPIEELPLPAGTVDLVVSNCVVNLSPDKPAVLAEAFRVLAPGGRLAISDVVRTSGPGPEEAPAGGCLTGALTRGAWLDGLARAGFDAPEVEMQGPFASGYDRALITAERP